jgi:plasmid stabilization system protein ParE
LAEVVFSADAEHDLFSIYSYLFEAYERLGDRPDDASLAAEARVLGLRKDVSALLQRTSRIGTARHDVLEGTRFVPVGRAVAYFRQEADRVVVLGVFYGGQDHLKRMSDRLIG